VLPLLLALACAGPPDAPPAAGAPCETNTDCAKGVHCGYLPLCIAGRCELGAEGRRPGSRWVTCDLTDAAIVGLETDE
jgi:hypothetical protein